MINQEATILIIDDEQSYLDVITQALKGRNFRVLHALNGKMGCMVAEKFIPDIIICDWEMPVMDGITAIKELKRNPFTAEIPVIMATGKMTNHDDLIIALEAGAVDYLRKPIDVVELVARINSMLKLSRSFKEIAKQKESILSINYELEIKNQEIIEQRDKLKELNATKDKFFSIIAHDLKSPFQGFLNFTEILSKSVDTFTPDRLKTISKLMHENASNLFKLLKNLLEWAQMQNGTMHFNPEIVSLNSLTVACIETIKERCKQKEISIINAITEDYHINADYQMIYSVMTNLITNAVKFTNRGGKIVISAYLNEENILKVSVKDTGVGMSKEELQKLFKVGEKIGSKGTEGEPSTGIGLLLSKEFIEKHSGKIWVESELGKGSTFYFTLPI